MSNFRQADKLGVFAGIAPQYNTVHEYSPLRALELRAIDDSLNAKDFEKAQLLLAQVGTQPDLQAGVAYLATRLLFLKGRLDATSVIERMRELVGANPKFEEARLLMDSCAELLGASGSPPPTPLTPRPGSLFPAGPPAPSQGTSETASFDVSRVASLSLEALDESDDEAPESWPVPGLESFEVVDDQDRPTFVPETGSSDSRSSPETRSHSPESLARTEYPGPLTEYAAPQRVIDNLSREIRVDTRESLLPKAPSMPPPSRYDASSPRVVGRYSGNEADVEVVLPQQRPPSGTGRYRLANPEVEDTIPTSLRGNSKRAAFEATSRRAARLVTSHHPISSSTPPFPPPSSGTVVTNPTPTVVRTDYLELDVLDEPTPFRVPRPSSGVPPSSQEPPSSYAWNDPERLFARGDASGAKARLEQKALELLEPYPTAFEVFPDKVDEIVHLLSATPVIHYFAPFDRSLCSLPRMELAIRTLYDGANSLPIASVRPLLALYVGEVLRVSHRGSWRGVPERPSTWAVEAGAHIWQPIRCISQLLSDPPGQSLLQSVGSGLAKRGTVAWMTTAAFAPPLIRPWHDPLTPQKQAELGHWVAHSPWSGCCERLFGHPLDGSIDSLKALDRLLDFLCDSAETPQPDEPWLVRTATLAGAYVGLVLTSQAHAKWLDRMTPTQQGIALELPGGIIATPVANVVARATSRKRSQLADYVRALLRRSL